MLSVSEALGRITDDIGATDGEVVPLLEATGRVLATDLAARLTQPPFNASSMDGYALRASDLGDGPGTLTVIGRSAAGHGFPGRLEAGQAVRIFTGAPLPDGADSVVIQEDCEQIGDRVSVRGGARPGRFVRPRGLDFERDQVILRAGRRATSRDISLAAQMGYGELTVHRRPRVAILATGDELVPPGTTPGPAQIISSIPSGLAGVIRNAGGEAVLLGIAGDTPASLDQHIRAGGDCDILVTIGGASVGEHDLVQHALIRHGMTLDFWKVAMRPGKPLMFGRLGTRRVLGLPGNPVSAFVCARIFLVPLIARLLGIAETELPAATRTVALGAPLEANGPRQHYMRAEIRRENDETVTLPLASQDSSLLSLLARADCLIVRPPHAPEARIGEAVEVLLLDF